MILAAAILCAVNCTVIEKAPADTFTAQCIADREVLVLEHERLQAIIADMAKRLEMAEKPETKKPRKRVCYRGRVLNAKNQCVRKK